MADSPIDDSVPGATPWAEAPRLDAAGARARVLASGAGEYKKGDPLRLAGQLSATCPRCHLTITIEGGHRAVSLGLQLIAAHPAVCPV